jgi:hypothetical protein
LKVLRELSFIFDHTKSLPCIAAIDEFHELKKELSHISRRSSVNPGKAEEGAANEEDFNLSDFLHGMSNDQKEAGHRLKHLGVVWKNLSVEVTGIISLFIGNY